MLNLGLFSGIRFASLPRLMGRKDALIGLSTSTDDDNTVQAKTDLSITLLSQAGLACNIRLKPTPSPAGGGLNDVNSLNPEPQAYLAASLRLPKVHASAEPPLIPRE
jgi:hypothetical protein